MYISKISNRDWFKKFHSYSKIDFDIEGKFD